MEHSCPKCGTAVEDGTPFCRHCRAPQIRVAVEPAIELPRTPADFLQGPAALTRPASGFLSRKVDWSHGLPCAAMGGFLALFLSFIPLFLFGPAYLLSGAFCVFLYRRRTGTEPSTGMAARLGAAAGMFGGLFLSVVLVAFTVYMPDKIREGISAQLKAGHYDPDLARNLMDFINTKQGLMLSMISSLILVSLICMIGASIGGAWYSAWLQKRNRS